MSRWRLWGINRAPGHIRVMCPWGALVAGRMDCHPNLCASTIWICVQWGPVIDEVQVRWVDSREWVIKRP